MKDKRSDLSRLVIALVVAMSLFGCATSPKPLSGLPEGVPLPKDIHVVSPPADLPKEIAAFSGKWTGKWDGIIDSVLIVEEINDKEARIIVASESYSGPMMIGAPEAIQGGYMRVLARVGTNPKPNIEFEIKKLDQPVVTFEMQKDLKTIKGFWTYISDLWEDHLPIIRITLKRAN